MFKIVVAEDEQLERLALEQALDDFLGETCEIHLAANGREALEAVSRVHADLALMDIEMPGMNGIEAARAIRAAEPDCHIVFLTAYSEFTYARQAVELGAMDYLLKPCADHELRTVVLRALGQIESRREEELRHRQSDRKIQNLTQQLEEQLVLTVMGGYLRPERVNNQLAELNIVFTNGAFAILRSPDGISAERIRSMVKGCGWQTGMRLIMYEYDDSLYILAVNSLVGRDCAAAVAARLSELSEQLQSFSKKQLFCAVGGLFERLEDAQDSFYQAQAALGRCSAEERVCGARGGTAPLSSETNLNFEDAICHSVLQGDAENVAKLIGVVVEGLLAQQLDYRTLAERVGRRMDRIFARLREETGSDYAERYGVTERLARAGTHGELSAEAVGLLTELTADVSRSRGSRMEQITQEIADYMGRNYRRDIFLQQVAQEMNYSDAYFSKLFKQCFHKNFITYLTEARVEAAKELLRNPTVNIKEVGAQVGYKDSNYFTKVFRRATGKSPSEYRFVVLPSTHAQG